MYIVYNTIKLEGETYRDFYNVVETKEEADGKLKGFCDNVYHFTAGIAQIIESTEAHHTDIKPSDKTFETVPDLLEAAQSLMIDAIDRGEAHDDEGKMYRDYANLQNAIDRAVKTK